MSGAGALAVGIVLAVALGLGVRRRRAGRLARTELRLAGRWAVLDQALHHRAEAALRALGRNGVDPVVALLVADAAAVALDPPAAWGAREQAESDLTQIIDVTGLTGVERETDRVVLARRLYNDAVVSSRRLRSRRTIRLPGDAARPAAAEPFEIAEPALGLRA